VRTPVFVRSALFDPLTPVDDEPVSAGDD